MIATENIESRGKTLKRTYSDNNKYIINVETNQEYTEAFDNLEVNHIYEETEKDIPIHTD